MTRVLALTGGLASGKSLVSQFLKRHHIPIIDADQIARKVVEPHRTAWRKLRQNFGKSFFGRRGHLLRKKLAYFIFAHPKKRRLLEKITHPEIWKEVQKRIAGYRTCKANLVVVVIPLLFETRTEKKFSGVIVVWVDRTTQVRRLMKRDGLNRSQALSRLKSQMPLGEKKKRATYLIDNRRTKKKTLKAMQDLLKRLV